MKVVQSAPARVPELPETELVEGVWLVPEPTGGRVRHSYTLLNAKREEIGYIETRAATPGRWYPEVKILDENYQRRGVYSKFLALATLHYPVFTSDPHGHTSDGAAEAWRKVGATRQEVYTPGVGHNRLWVLDKDAARKYLNGGWSV